MATKWKNRIKRFKDKDEANQAVELDKVEEIEETQHHEERVNEDNPKKERQFSIKFGTLVIGFLSLILLVFSGSELYANYDAIDKTKDNYGGNNYFQYYDFQDKMRKISFGIYYDALMETMTEDEALAKIFTHIEDKDDALILLSDFYDELYVDNLHYTISYLPTNTQISSMPSQMADYFIDGLSESELADLNDYYQFFVQFTYDEKGSLSIDLLKGAELKYFKNHWSNENPNEHINYTENPLANISETVITFGVPKQMTPYGSLYWEVSTLTTNAYTDAMMPYVLIFASMIVLFVLIVPYHLLSRLGLLKVINKIPYEIIIFGLILSLVFFILEIAPNMIYMTQSNELLVSLNKLFPTLAESDALFYVSILNALTWAIGFGVWFIAVYTIKGLFINRLWTSIKNRSILFWLLNFVKKGITSLWNNMCCISLDKPFKRNLRMALGINFVIVSLLCATWFFGVIGVLIYTAFLYWFLTKKLAKFWDDYAKVKMSVAELADGNLNLMVEQDFGYFEDLKEDIKTLSVGFKKAVEDEVKSTRMKTELISNVSHDLKTPLTSIITYVDLLKNPDLNEDLRQEYIDTLDRKADRLKILIEDLFEMSKASSGNVNLNPVELDVVSLMKQTLFEAEDKIQATNLQIREQYSNEKIILQLDSMYTYRIFENLVLNMTKYAMPCTRAYIEMNEDEAHVSITLKNMSAQEITVSPEEIVERFVRNDAARHTEGSGLGLAISKSFVQMQHGTFEITVDGDLFKVNIVFPK